MENLRPVDHNALRTNQVLIIGINILAFILNNWWLAAFVTLSMTLGTLYRVPGFGWIYGVILKPLGLVKPDLLLDNPEPHRFAQGLGAVFMLAGTAIIVTSLPFAGWTLVWIVVGLAALNLFAGFCTGCAVYYWLARLRIPGFDRLPPQGILPGMRPKVRA